MKFFFEISLFFKEASPKEIESQMYMNMTIDDQMLAKFVKVTEKKFELKKINKGTFMHFYPVQFTGGYFSSAQVMIHSSIIGKLLQTC